jgi:hypothetical protein
VRFKNFAIHRRLAPAHLKKTLLMQLTLIASSNVRTIIVETVSDDAEPLSRLEGQEADRARCRLTRRRMP